MTRTIVPAAAFALLLTAAADTPFQPGLWEIRNTPGAATLDGRALDDLPLGDLKTQRLCVAAAQAADPVALFLRDTETDCKVSSASLAGGKVKVAGTCANQDGGMPGSLALTGSYGRDRYDVDFSTSVTGDNGRMEFSGKLSGRRIGACPG